MESKVKCPHSISRTCLAQEFGLVLDDVVVIVVDNVVALALVVTNDAQSI